MHKSVHHTHQRASALLIVAGLLGSSAAVSQEIRHAVSEFAVQPVFAIIEHSNKGNEITEQMMTLEQVMPANPIGGE